MKKLYIEVADTYSKKERGLMYRKHMSKDEGMLFKFAYANRLSFWMQNTYIPLDIAFLDDDGKILQIESMTPLSTKTITSRDHCKYALEVNKGWFKENKIKAGDYISGIAHQRKTAAGAGDITEGTPPTELSIEPPTIDPLAQPSIQPNQPPTPQQPAAQVLPKNTSPENIKRVLEKAKNESFDVLILYKGRPTLISPYKQMEFVKGKRDSDKDDTNAEATIPSAVVKVWDNNSGHPKSFTIEDIVSITDKNGQEINLQNKQEIPKV